MNLDQVNSFIDNKEFDKAVLSLELMLEQDIQNTEALYAYLTVVMYLGSFDKALDHCKKFMEVGVDANVMQIAATILIFKGEFAEAKKMALQIVELDDANIEAKILLINCKFLEKQDDESALDELKQLYLNNSDDLVVQFYYILYLKQFDRMDEYKELLDKFRVNQSEMAELIESSTLENAISSQIEMLRG